MATRALLPVLMLSLLLAGCAGGTQLRGFLVTKITYPHMTDFDRTTVGSRRCVIDDHRIKDVFTRSGISVEWTETAIRAAARDCGLTTLSHADIELFSVLRGVYERRRLIVYGD